MYVKGADSEFHNYFRKFCSPNTFFRQILSQNIKVICFNETLYTGVILILNVTTAFLNSLSKVNFRANLVLKIQSVLFWMKGVAKRYWIVLILNSTTAFLKAKFLSTKSPLKVMKNAFYLFLFSRYLIFCFNFWVM